MNNKNLTKEELYNVAMKGDWGTLKKYALRTMEMSEDEEYGAEEWATPYGKLVIWFEYLLLDHVEWED